ncbi:ABC transporter ATP-binding protein [Krasilnikovia sp. MM14-A1259]|uniref:ABC transporter ATP-binding protein n=1 Tax=Krasilnikovia sp. MM14-A1259 TaxID=3373539 RepID=UPI0037F9E020
MSAAIRFDTVCVDYGRTRALSDFTLTVDAGETVALLGPSGSGKSTALQALAGFIPLASGRVYLTGRDVTGLPPYERGLGVVVQQYALFPHMRVADNVAFGLRARRVRRSEAASRVADMLKMVGMSAYARRYPAELSGGQQQRVAIARALAVSPDVLLLDEPLSALDAKLRQDMIGELQQLRIDLPDIAMLYVTHDQVEALSLAERIVVMRDGRMVDTGPAGGLYRRPPSPFTASFLGDANLIPATVIGAGLVRAGALTVRCSTAGFAQDDRPLLCLRPHELGVGDGWGARLTAVQWRGANYRLSVDLDGLGPLRVDVGSVHALPEVGRPISILPAEGAGVLVPAGEVS